MKRFTLFIFISYLFIFFYYYFPVAPVASYYKRSALNNTNLLSYGLEVRIQN